MALTLLKSFFSGMARAIRFRCDSTNSPYGSRRYASKVSAIGLSPKGLALCWTKVRAETNRIFAGSIFKLFR